MVISGFWGFAIVLIVAILILAISFQTKVEKTYVDKDGKTIKEISYEFRWGFNKTDKN